MKETKIFYRIYTATGCTRCQITRRFMKENAIDESELADTIALAAWFPEYQFHTTIAPLERKDGSVTYLSPREIGETARQIEAATESKKHPYTLRIHNPQQAEDDRFKSIEPLPDSAVFNYRTAARRYMVMTEIEK